MLAHHRGMHKLSRESHPLDGGRIDDLIDESIQRNLLDAFKPNGL